MDRNQKTQEIADLSERFSRVKAAFLVDFKGMTVEQVTSLRKKLRPSGAEMRVVRNTLAKRALINYPQTGAVLNDALVGTNAVIFAYKDVSASAKTLADFTKDVEKFQLKIGVMDGAKLDESKIKYLATLPSKEVLRAKLLGLFQAPMSRFLGQLNAPASSFVRVLSAHKDKQG